MHNLYVARKERVIVYVCLECKKGMKSPAPLVSGKYHRQIQNQRKRKGELADTLMALPEDAAPLPGASDNGSDDYQAD